jgi:hypothetical protein
MSGFFGQKNFLARLCPQADIHTQINKVTRATQSTRAELLIPTVSGNHQPVHNPCTFHGKPVQIGNFSHD